MLKDLQASRHDHVFVSRHQGHHEKRTRLVIALTAFMMVLEITAGMLFGSMALLADGWHMASHAGALGITALGYIFARRYASNPKFSFGTGKVGELAGYSSALVLAFIALLMAYESIKRFFAPVDISFDEAIGVAIVGFIVNIVSALLLKEDHGDHERGHHHVDHNLRAAYLHVLADALTSVLAIVALSAGRFLGWVWMDPFMGIVGAVVISRWSYGLMRDTGRILLDVSTSDTLSRKVKQQIESEGDTAICDLHLWRLAPSSYAAIIAIVTKEPYTPSYYKNRLKEIRLLRHITIEINPYSQGS